MGKRVRGLIVKSLSARQLPVCAAVIGVLLTLPSLGAGLMVDDYHHRLVMMDPDNPDQFLRSKTDLFCFLDDSGRIDHLLDLGMVPWWAGTDCRAAFWRPLSSLTHLLDYTLWPDVPLLMHVQSIFWYAALCALAALLYRRIMPVPWMAGLAAVLFAIDSTHATPVGFLANRNTLISAVFGVLALVAHDRWRRRNWRPGIGLALLLLTLSLLAKEAGAATCAYLAAYALFFDDAKPSKRLICLAPYAVVVVAWRLVYAHYGYGISNSSIYFDPIAEPQRYLERLHVSAVFFLAGKWTLFPSEASFLLPRQTADAVWFGAVVFLFVLALILMPVLRRDPSARFLAAGMLLSLPVVCTTLPANRILMFVGIGASGLLAQFLGAAMSRDLTVPLTRCWRYPAAVLASLLLLIHSLISPICLAVESARPMGPRWILDSLYITHFSDETIAQQDVIVVNPPLAFFAGLSLANLQCDDQPIPKHLRALTSSLMQSITIHRTGARTLRVRPEQGYLASPLDCILGQLDDLQLGEQVRLKGLTIEITELTDDGRPAEAQFTFDVPLEDPSLRWLHWKNWKYLPFTPPAIGETQELNNFDQPLWKQRA